jgi:hypothetical protein
MFAEAQSFISFYNQSRYHTTPSHFKTIIDSISALVLGITKSRSNIQEAAD